MDQGSGRVTSPSRAPRIRRGNRKGLCANWFLRSSRKIIYALGLSTLPLSGSNDTGVVRTMRKYKLVMGSGGV